MRIRYVDVYGLHPGSALGRAGARRAGRGRLRLALGLLGLVRLLPVVRWVVRDIPSVPLQDERRGREHLPDVRGLAQRAFGKVGIAEFPDSLKPAAAAPAFIFVNRHGATSRSSER